MIAGVRIVAPHFVAAVEAQDGCVVRTAPILRYTMGWTGEQVAAYCRRKGWEWQRLGDRPG